MPKKPKHRKPKDEFGDEDCPVCGLVDVVIEDTIEPHKDRWQEPCPGSGLNLAEAPKVAKQYRCDHHWHEPNNPLRIRHEGWTQAVCCGCFVRAWVKLKTKKACRTNEALRHVRNPLPKVKEAEVTYG